MGRVDQDADRIDVSDLGPGQKRPVRVEGWRLLLCNAGGRIYAIEEFCTHRSVSLAGGWVRDGVIQCPEHGACYDLRDGSVRSGPAPCPIRVFPVQVRDGYAEICVDD